MKIRFSVGSPYPVMIGHDQEPARSDLGRIYLELTRWSSIRIIKTSDGVRCEHRPENHVGETDAS